MPDTEITELHDHLQRINNQLEIMADRQKVFDRFCRDMTQLLRGEGNSSGMVGRVEIMWRSWVFLIGCGGMVAGWLLKTLVG